MKNKAQEALISVWMITYNHEAYISRAIEGVLMQKVDFPIELVISDDCSTDQTWSICNEYKKKHPNIINLIKREKNIGLISNFIQTLSVCTGTYIALCEGDDFWTDPEKLLKQKKILDANRDFSICFHQITVLNERNGMTNLHSNFHGKSIFSIADIIKGNFIPTCSVMFRKPKDENFYSLSSFKIGDWPLYNILLKDGSKAVFLNETMAVYRMHDSGFFSPKSYFDQLIIIKETILNLKKTIPQFGTYYNSALIKTNYAIALEEKKQSRINISRSFLKESLFLWGGWSGFVYQLKFLIHTYTPSLKNYVNYVKNYFIATKN